MARSNYRSGKDMPAEFFLPPADDKALWEETIKLVALCAVFLVALGVVVAFTQHIVITI